MMMPSSGGTGSSDFPRECPLAKLGRSSPPYHHMNASKISISRHDNSSRNQDQSFSPVHLRSQMSVSANYDLYDDHGDDLKQVHARNSPALRNSLMYHQYTTSNQFDNESADTNSSYNRSFDAIIRNSTFERYNVSSTQSSHRRFASPHAEIYQNSRDTNLETRRRRPGVEKCQYFHRNVTTYPLDASYDRYGQKSTCNYIVDQIEKLGRASPSYDQGYHTLVSPSPGPSTPRPWIDCPNKNPYQGKARVLSRNSFSILPDLLVLKIFQWLTSTELSTCSQVCRRFEHLVWTPGLWKHVVFSGGHINADEAIRNVLFRLCSPDTHVPCLSIERVFISDGARLSDQGLLLLARKCPELTHLQLQGCVSVTNGALFEFIAHCHNLQHLDISGCTRLSSLSPPNISRKLLLQYLDLTDCSALDDNGLRLIVASCPQLVYLYLRRCVQITDAGIKCVPSFCSTLRELSVSDCTNLTDFGLYELAKLGATLRYLSVAKCDRVSDPGLKVIVRRCYKLRYLNARGCEAVSDDAITVLARSCPRLRALDIGKCDVTDNGLRELAESCPNLKKLSLRNCELITDKGVQYIAYYCRGLQLLNIQDCQITIEGYRAVKKFCKRCVIEHTNPGFF